jgi:hypothetical protein
MKLLKQFFLPNLNEKRWFRILIWWELRRIPYNVFLLLFLSISFYFLSLIPNDGFIRILPGPGLIVGFYITLLLFFIGANILFTTGSIFQIITRNYNHKLIYWVRKFSLLIGIIVSFIVTLCPIIIALIKQLLQ